MEGCCEFRCDWIGNVDVKAVVRIVIVKSYISFVLAARIHRGVSLKLHSFREDFLEIAICQWHAAKVRAAGNMLCTDRRRVQQKAARQRRQRERDAQEAAGTDRYRRLGDGDGLQRGRETMVLTRFVERDGSLSAPTLTSTHVRAENLAERTPRVNPNRRASGGSNSSSRRRRTAREAGITSPGSGRDSGDGARARRRARRDRSSDEGPDIVIPPSVETEPPTAETAGGDSQEEAAGAGTGDISAPQQEQEGEGGDGLDDSEDGLLARHERRRPPQHSGEPEQIREAVSNGIDLLQLLDGEPSGDQDETRLWLDSDEDDDDSKKGNNSSNTDGAAHWLDAALGIQPGDQEVEEDHKDQDEEDDPNNDLEDEDQLTPHQHTPATAPTTSQASHETTQD